MRDILISSAVCVGCLMLALVSQIVAPTPAQATAPAASEVRPAAKAAAVNPAAPPAELDPNESNPRLFAMAPEAGDQVAQGSAADLLGGEMEATKERMTPSGLKITDLEEGTGAEAQSGNTVSVNYRGTLTNGQEFDSSYKRGEPISFPLNGVIRGWTEGLQLMKEGGKTTFYIPQDLAYGARPAPGGAIPPYAALVFEVELIKVNAKP